MLSNYNTAVNELAYTVHEMIEQSGVSKPTADKLNDLMIRTAEQFDVDMVTLEDDINSAYEALPIEDMEAAQTLKYQGRLN